jgi:Nucleotide modification associated domain 3
MRIIFSRKGFDSGSGGGPSPIIDGRPISLPIPAVPNSNQHSATRYRDIGLGDVVEQMSRYIKADHFCHHDPYFTSDGHCAFGQESAAQGHLTNQGVGPGDVFLFFGLFANPDGRDLHHRIFGCLEIEDIMRPGAIPRMDEAPAWAPQHPHYIVRDPTRGTYNANNSLYVGTGQTAEQAHPALRLTAQEAHNPAKLTSLWQVPPWLRRIGLTYHGADWRWQQHGDRHFLRSVGRGQEFVADIGDDGEAKLWVNTIIDQIRGR